MSAFLNISSCGERTKLGAGNGKRNSRWYYLAVEEEEWDYGPSGLNKLTGTPLNQSGRYVEQLACFQIMLIEDLQHLLTP